MALDLFNLRVSYTLSNPLRDLRLRPLEFFGILLARLYDTYCFVPLWLILL